MTMTRSLSDLVQGSEQWLSWRRGGIGASEVASIMGISKWGTPYSTFCEKVRKSTGFKGNYATRRGTELEAKARARYELLALEDMPPSLAVHPNYPMLRCSLDGFSMSGKRVLEIKCPGLEDHQQALVGMIPDYYEVQVQYQLAVTGADLADYFSYYDPEQKNAALIRSHALITVEPNVLFQGRILSCVLRFWREHVLTRIPPPLMERDIMECDDNAEVVRLCRDLNSREQMSKPALDQLKAEIIRTAGHGKIRCGVFQISTVIRSGKFSHHKLTVNEESHGAA